MIAALIVLFMPIGFPACHFDSAAGFQPAMCAALCEFDGPVIEGHWVVASETITGDCHDAGVDKPKTTDWIGRARGTGMAGAKVLIDLGYDKQ